MSEPVPTTETEFPPDPSDEAYKNLIAVYNKIDEDHILIRLSRWSEANEDWNFLEKYNEHLYPEDIKKLHGGGFYYLHIFKSGINKNGKKFTSQSDIAKLRIEGRPKPVDEPEPEAVTVAPATPNIETMVGNNIPSVLLFFTQMIESNNRQAQHNSEQLRLSEQKNTELLFKMIEAKPSAAGQPALTLQKLMDTAQTLRELIPVATEIKEMIAGNEPGSVLQELAPYATELVKELLGEDSEDEKEEIEKQTTKVKIE